MKSRPPGFNAAWMRFSANRPASRCRPSSAPTRMANAISKRSSLALNSKSSIATCLKSRRPDVTSFTDPARASLIAFSERSIARTKPSPMRRATSRAAAPGPHPISRTRSPCVNGRASTKPDILGDIPFVIRIASARCETAPRPLPLTGDEFAAGDPVASSARGLALVIIGLGMHDEGRAILVQEIAVNVEIGGEIFHLGGTIVMNR